MKFWAYEHPDDVTPTSSPKGEGPGLPRRSGVTVLGENLSFREAEAMAKAAARPGFTTGFSKDFGND